MSAESSLRAKAREVIRPGVGAPWLAWRTAWAICCSVNHVFFIAILPTVLEEGRSRVNSSSPNSSSFLGAGPCEFERDRDGRPHS